MTESRKRRISVGITMLLVQLFTIAGVIALGVVTHQQSEQAEIAAQAADAAAAESQERDEAIEALRDQVLALGEVPVVPQPSPAASTSTEQPRARDGKDAPPPTDAQVYAAVVQCFTTSVCLAPKGDPGTPGTDGDDGRNAPAPTAEQLSAAVEQCFAAGSCVAPKGDQGDQGPAGPAGQPGPTCPDGYTPMSVWLRVSDEEIGIPRQQQAIVCLPTHTEGETP